MAKKRLGFTDKQLKQIRVTVGRNLAAARKNAGMTQAEVMRIVWNVDNNRNRISEIENGNKDLTLTDLLIFQNLYNQSLDYICGLSVEPELDMLASTVNHVVTQSRAIVEHLTEQFAETITEHMKSICVNDQEALLAEAKQLCRLLKEQEVQKDSQIAQSAKSLMSTIRKIESKQARQIMAVETQMMQIKQRLDKEDKHIMLSDLDCDYQYSLPLPEPVYSDEEMIKGVN